MTKEKQEEQSNMTLLNLIVYLIIATILSYMFKLIHDPNKSISSLSKSLNSLTDQYKKTLEDINKLKVMYQNASSIGIDHLRELKDKNPN